MVDFKDNSRQFVFAAILDKDYSVDTYKLYIDSAEREPQDTHGMNTPCIKKDSERISVFRKMTLLYGPSRIHLDLYPFASIFYDGLFRQVDSITSRVQSRGDSVGPEEINQWVRGHLLLSVQGLFYSRFSSHE